MKTSRPSSRYGSTLLERGVAHLHPGDVVDELAQPFDDGDGNRVAGRALQLVDVERQRRAGAGGGREMREQLVLVEREVGRRDHRHRFDSELGCVRRERYGVCGCLRAAVGKHREWARSEAGQRSSTFEK